jgi:hypothetical protein
MLFLGYLDASHFPMEKDSPTDSSKPSGISTFYLAVGT